MLVGPIKFCSSCKNSEKVLELDACLKQWINECLAGQRIIVKDLEEDLFDGQVLQRLFEHLQIPRVVYNHECDEDESNYDGCASKGSIIYCAEEDVDS